jgi:hypothetical protein
MGPGHAGLGVPREGERSAVTAIVGTTRPASRPGADGGTGGARGVPGAQPVLQARGFFMPAILHACFT